MSVDRAPPERCALNCRVSTKIVRLEEQRDIDREPTMEHGPVAAVLREEMASLPRILSGV